jgi:tight adherence protein B
MLFGQEPTTLLAMAGAFGLVMTVFAMGILWWTHRQRQQVEQVRERLDPAITRKGARTLRLWHEGEEATALVPGREMRLTMRQKLNRFRLAAGWEATPRTLMIRLAIIASLTVVGAALATARVMPPLVGGITVVVGFWWLGSRSINKRNRLFERQLMDGLELSSRALRAGHPLLAAFQLIAEEVPAPVGTLFSELCQQQAMGAGMEEALRRASVQSRSPDMKLFSATLAINLRTGGNMANVMDSLANVIRQRMRLSRRFRVLIAQTQFSKRILLGLPFAMFGVLNLISPEYISVLYDTDAGNLMMGFSLLSLLMGWFMMSRMATLKA